jgi:hypothetical protein
MRSAFATASAAASSSGWKEGRLQREGNGPVAEQIGHHARVRLSVHENRREGMA